MKCGSVRARRTCGMRYFALASDYDGTLAHDGVVDHPTLDALDRLHRSGRALILVTGRELDDLRLTFPEMDRFDLIVAENGALLYRPSTKEERTLAAAPPEKLAATLRERGVSPLSVGRVIVATWQSQEVPVLETIRDLGLELQVIFNKGAVMILPSGVNKATGLQAALDELGLSRHNVVSVGDAENDHAFLSIAECAAVVSNALPSLKEEADLVTDGDHGRGVSELIDRLLQDDLQSLSGRLERHFLLLGKGEDGQDVRIPPYGTNILLAGGSGGGKSTLTTGVLERLDESGRQFCAIDPEGDYQSFTGAVILGDTHRAPTVDEILSVLEKPDHSVIVNLLGVPLDQRPEFFESLLPRLQELRARCGRPHWIVIDEAMHMLPASWTGTGQTWPQELTSTMLVTLNPEELTPVILQSIDFLIAVGEEPQKVIAAFCDKRGLGCPNIPDRKLERGQAVAWRPKGDEEPFRFRVAPCKTGRTRHSRKYSNAELTPDRSFYFRGPEGKLNLRASNLFTFVRLAEGVDDETWLFHLRQGEYSRWFHENIKNDELANSAEEVEREGALSAAESRQRIREQIESRYTLPG